MLAHHNRLKHTIEEEETNLRDRACDESTPVQILPAIVLVSNSKSSYNRTSDQHDIDEEVRKNDPDVSVLVRYQFWNGNESDAGDAATTTVETEPGDEHVGRRSSCADDVSHSGNELTEQEKVAASKQVRIGSTEQDGDSCCGCDAGDHPGGELCLTQSLKELRRNGGCYRSRPNDIRSKVVIQINR